MLRKLLKYDLKSGLRIFGFVWLGIAAMVGLMVLLFSVNVEENTAVAVSGTLGMIPTILAIAGAILFANIYAAIRFFKGLLGREGYLMFTLPTTPWKLLTSKLISAFFFVAVTMVISLGGIMIVLTGMFRTMFGEFFDVFGIFGMDEGFGWSHVIMIANYIVSAITGILQIYFACCLGHLCSGKRGLFAVLFYFAINICVSIVTNILTITLMEYSYDALSVLAQEALYVSLPVNIGLGILYFFFSERILRNKLNLE